MPNTPKRNMLDTLQKEYSPKTISDSMTSSEFSSDDVLGKLINTVDGIVIGVLQKFGPVTRSMIVEITGLPRTTLYDSLIRLILKGFVRKFTEERNQRGRPKVYYQLSV